MLQKVLPDLLLVTGSASISFGAWLVFPPAGFIVGGFLLLATGVKLAKAA